jgi:glutathione S-transferase
MDLYFSPLACSLATRIALYESGLDAETRFHNVTLSTKRYDNDLDFVAVTAQGQVPALITRDGTLLTENAAVLQYVADLAPTSQLAPAPTDPMRYRLQQWLSFVGTELHKQVFAVLFNPKSPPEAKAFAFGTMLPVKLAIAERAVTGRSFLVGDSFTVADAYLTTTLNWCRYTKVDFTPFPALADYHTRMLARPHVKRAFKEERTLAEAS